MILPLFKGSIRSTMKIKNKKLFACIFCMGAALFCVYAQNPVVSAPDAADSDTQKNARIPEPGNLVFTLGAIGILNNQQSGAPSPVLFSIGAGAQFPVRRNLSVSPHGHYFGTYYLWDSAKSQALPAEVEQRTAYVPAILFDLPLTFDYTVRRSTLHAGGGLSFLIRFAARAASVPSGEDSDILAINRWFWEKARFLYPSLQFSWDYAFANGLSLGLGLKAYFSAGALIDKAGIDRSMLVLSMRIIPPAF